MGTDRHSLAKWFHKVNCKAAVLMWAVKGRQCREASSGVPGLTGTEMPHGQELLMAGGKGEGGALGRGTSGGGGGAWAGEEDRQCRGLICSPLPPVPPPCSLGDPRRHQRLYRILGCCLPGGAVSAGGEGPPGPGGHSLWLVPGPGLDQLHR